MARTAAGGWERRLKAASVTGYLQVCPKAAAFSYVLEHLGSHMWGLLPGQNVVKSSTAAAAKISSAKVAC